MAVVRQHRLVRGLLVAVCVAVVAWLLTVAVLAVAYVQTCSEAPCGFTHFTQLLFVAGLSLALAALILGYLGYLTYAWRTIKRHDRTRELAARDGIPAISLEYELHTGSITAIALPAMLRIVSRVLARL
jgi:hypothetical protein